MSKVFIPTTNSGKLREFNHAFASLNMECIGNNDARSILGSAFDWNIPIEDMQTFSGNGCKKLNEALRVFPKLSDVGVNSVLVDDSGLCVSRLNYEPGVHSATYAGEPRSDQKNREFLSEMLVQRLRLSEADSEPAFFVCSLLRANPICGPSYDSRSVVLSFSEFVSKLERVEGDIMARLTNRLEAVSSAAYAFAQQVKFEQAVYCVQLVMGFCVGRVAVKEQKLLENEGHGYDAMFFPAQLPHLSFASIPLAQKNKMSHRSEALRGLNVLEKSHNALGETLELF